MKKLLIALCVTLALATLASAQMDNQNNRRMRTNPRVGGAEMMSNRDIIDNAVNSPVHTTLVAAVRAAGLVETLKGTGPFTVFAPTNAAFEKLPAGTVETLVRPESREMLRGILTYHVVAGALNSRTIARQIRAGNGSARLTTVAGATLTAMMDGRTLVLTDEKGGRSRVEIADVYQSNGIIHSIDTVLMPN